MSLRSRLIVAFLLLSVVPLSAVTLLSYRSSAAAFERAAEREAAESASDVSRRMEVITADVGRRVDRIFVSGKPAAESAAPELGDAALLVERVEFHPAVPPAAPPEPAEQTSPPPPPVPPQPAAPATAGAVPTSPFAPIVIDVPKLLAEATEAANAAGHVAPEAEAKLEAALEKQILHNQQTLRRLAETAMARQAEARLAASRPAEHVQVAADGRHVEVPVHSKGKLVGRAKTTLNMDRTLRTVLALARRDQGEIPFAIDRKGALYAPEPRDKDRLRALGVEGVAARFANGKPWRAGDWIVVARRDPGGVIFGIARPVGESLREIRRAAVRNLSFGLMVIGLALVGIVPISRRMTLHLSSLTGGVRQLAGGDFRTRVPVRSSDEFGALARAFNQMAQDLERHQALVVEQERLRRELELSRLIQTEMLPRAPLRSGAAEIAGVSIPAREVGGDFFNYFVLPDGRLALLVGDVSGKGVGAALLMANVQATLRARLPHETDLAALADHLDRELDANTPGAVYLTLFLAILEQDGRTLRYVNAGHNPQFVLRTGGGIQPLTSTGLPIALYSGHGYREQRIALAPGDLLFFYTDGLVETENEAEEMFGAERLQALLGAQHAQQVGEILERVEAHVSGFRGSAEPLDDATMMVLRISAAEERA